MLDYVALYLDSQLATGTPSAFFSLILLGMARMLPIIGMSPFFGSRVMTNPAKVVFGFSLVAIMLPTMLTHLKGPLDFNFMLIIYALKELFIGFSIGFLMSLPFSIVQNAGLLIDHQRGGSSLMVNDPSVQAQTSPIGTLCNLVLIFLFYMIDAHILFIDAINTSYEMIPPDQFLSEKFFRVDNTFWETQKKIFNTVMVISTQLGAPALIVILMTDLFLGIANRLAPQVQVTFLGMSLKSWLALLVIWVGWKAYNEQTIVEIYRFLDILRQSIFALKT